jgi:hypothetical protein
MKISTARKNSRRVFVGKPPLNRRVPGSSGPLIDVEHFCLKTLSGLKANPPPGFPEARRQELAVWNPPAVHCHACGWEGTLNDCGRTHFPPDDIGWDCGGCNVRLAEGRDYQSNQATEEQP